MDIGSVQRLLHCRRSGIARSLLGRYLGAASTELPPPQGTSFAEMYAVCFGNPSTTRPLTASSSLRRHCWAMLSAYPKSLDATGSTAITIPALEASPKPSL